MREPEPNDPVWVGERRERGKQPNGYVLRLNKDEDEDIESVLVKFHDCEDVEEIDWSEMEGSWTQGYGGVWLMGEP